MISCTTTIKTKTRFVCTNSCGKLCACKHLHCRHQWYIFCVLFFLEGRGKRNTCILFSPNSSDFHFKTILYLKFLSLREPYGRREITCFPYECNLDLKQSLITIAAYRGFIYYSCFRLKLKIYANKLFIKHVSNVISFTST